jgi:hypothetical protein
VRDGSDAANGKSAAAAPKLWALVNAVHKQHPILQAEPPKAVKLISTDSVSDTERCCGQLAKRRYTESHSGESGPGSQISPVLCRGLYVVDCKLKAASILVGALVWRCPVATTMETLTPRREAAGFDRLMSM